jgi:coenzyme F420-reducing hydrogenase beta subunit
LKICNENQCTGCTACASICPEQSIKMIINEQGFNYPVINKNMCISCGSCDNVISVLDNHMKTGEHAVLPRKSYAVRLKDANERMESQSGGAFFAIAKSIITSGGVVYGCAYDPSLNVKHIRVDNVENINQLRGSKYVQSDLNDCYWMIKKDLVSERVVLFSGTPCQCAGLLAFVKAKNLDSTNLYTCDIICHGVPSPKVYTDYISFMEGKAGKKIRVINLRDKYEGGWRNHVDSVIYQDGEKRVGKTYVDLFYSNFALRRSCEACQYTSQNRPADITLADCWGINKIRPGLWNDNKGISMVLLQTTKGDILFNEIREEQILDCEELKQGELIQPQMMHSSPIPYQKERFWKDYGELSFEKILKKYTEYGGLKFKIKRRVLKELHKW